MDVPWVTSDDLLAPSRRVHVEATAEYFRSRLARFGWIGLRVPYRCPVVRAVHTSTEYLPALQFQIPFSPFAFVSFLIMGFLLLKVSCLGPPSIGWCCVVPSFKRTLLYQSISVTLVYLIYKHTCEPYLGIAS
jgi:hypothetical protein